MSTRAETLSELRAVVDAQQELLRVILYVISEGPLHYDGQLFSCALERDKASATAAVSIGAGQSLNAFSKNSTETGLAVRDL